MMTDSEATEFVAELEGCLFNLAVKQKFLLQNPYLGFEFEDLMQEFRLAVWKEAKKNYDPTRGAKTTFAHLVCDSLVKRWLDTIKRKGHLVAFGGNGEDWAPQNEYMATPSGTTPDGEYAAAELVDASMAGMDIYTKQYAYLAFGSSDLMAAERKRVMAFESTGNVKSTAIIAALAMNVIYTRPDGSVYYEASGRCVSRKFFGAFKDE